MVYLPSMAAVLPRSSSSSSGDESEYENFDDLLNSNVDASLEEDVASNSESHNNADNISSNEAVDEMSRVVKDPMKTMILVKRVKSGLRKIEKELDEYKELFMKSAPGREKERDHCYKTFMLGSSIFLSILLAILCAVLFHVHSEERARLTKEINHQVRLFDNMKNHYTSNAERQNIEFQRLSNMEKQTAKALLETKAELKKAKENRDWIIHLKNAEMKKTVAALAAKEEEIEHLKKVHDEKKREQEAVFRTVTLPSDYRIRIFQIFVTDILRGNTGLHEGDEILAVNDVAVEGMGEKELVEFINEADHPIRLVMRANVHGLKMAKRAKEQMKEWKKFTKKDTEKRQNRSRRPSAEASISKDGRRLQFHTAGNDVITSVLLQLDSEGEESFLFPSHNRDGSVRIDSISATVFGEESIEMVGYLTPQCRETVDGCTTYTLRVTLHFDGALSPKSITPITSVKLNLCHSRQRQSYIAPVSRELLGVASEFFSSLFYSDFAERNNGVFKIEQVDKDDFLWLYVSLTYRGTTVSSVDKALSVMSLADRFRMKDVYVRLQPYVKSNLFYARDRRAVLKKFLGIATRFTDSQTVMWIFDKCESSEELGEVAHSCGNSLTPHLENFFRALALKQAAEKEKREKKVKELQIFVKMLDGKTSVFSVSSGTSILELKKQIQSKRGILVSEQRLVGGKFQLEDSRTLGDEDEEHNATFHVLLRLR